MKSIELSLEQKREVQKLEVYILKEINRICTKYNIKYMAGYGTLIGAVRHQGFIPWDDDMDLCMLREDFQRFKTACLKEFGNEFFYQSNDTDPEYFLLYDKIRLNGTMFRETHVAKYNINHGVYIDIFPIDYLPRKKMQWFLQYYGFHFFRTGVMAKYMMLDARKGKKRALFTILRLLYAPFSLQFLYNKAQHFAMKYDGKKSPYASNFYTPFRKKDIFKTSLYTNTRNVDFEDTQISIPDDYHTMLSKLYGDYMKLPPVEKQNTRHELTDICLNGITEK